MRSVALKLALSAAFTVIASAVVLTATTKQAHANYMPSSEIPNAGRPPGVMTVYIHGRNTVNGGDNGADYWNQGDQDLHSSLNYGSNPQYIRWSGADALSQSYAGVKAKLDYACGNGQLCDIVCHSTGCALIGMILSQNNYGGSIRQVYALAGAQGGTMGATRMIQVQQGVSATITDLIVSHFGGNALIGAIVRPIVDEAVNWAMSHLPCGSVTGVIYDLEPDRMRCLYNHDAGSVLTWTITADHDKHLNRCRWYQVGCHLKNAAWGLWNSVWFWLLDGSNDGVLPVQSTASHRFQSENRDICSVYGLSGLWTNHYPIRYPSQACGRGTLTGTGHMNVTKLVAEAKLTGQTLPYTETWDEGGPCDEDTETEGSCNSYDDYFGHHVVDYDGSLINARCGGYELSTTNTAYGYDCGSLRYSGTGGYSVGYDGATCNGCYTSVSSGGNYTGGTCLVDDGSCN